MFLVLNEDNETVFQGENFMEAANEAIRLGQNTQKGYGVFQEIWNTVMLVEETEIIDDIVEVA